MQVTRTDTTKRRFFVLSKNGSELLPANIPEHLTVGEARSELAGYAGFAPEPDVSTRYALWTAPRQPGGDYEEFRVLRDDVAFADVEELSAICIAPQPRPATGPSTLRKPSFRS